MASLFKDLVNLDSLDAEKGKTWPTLKTSFDVLRTPPLLFLYVSALVAMFSAGDLFSRTCFYILAPAVAALLFASLVQVATLLLLVTAGLVGYIPGATWLFNLVRSRWPVAFRVVSMALALLLGYVFIAMAIRLVIALQLRI